MNKNFFSTTSQSGCAPNFLTLQMQKKLQKECSLDHSLIKEKVRYGRQDKILYHLSKSEKKRTLSLIIHRIRLTKGQNKKQPLNILVVNEF